MTTPAPVAEAATSLDDLIDAHEVALVLGSKADADRIAGQINHITIVRREQMRVARVRGGEAVMIYQGGGERRSTIWLVSHRAQVILEYMGIYTPADLVSALLTHGENRFSSLLHRQRQCGVKTVREIIACATGLATR